MSNIPAYAICEILVFEEQKLRACGAEVEQTLQKCGGGGDFAMKNIAYHSLSPSFCSLIWPSLTISFLSVKVTQMTELAVGYFYIL